jgi:uncharacterized protein YidB (DUF937 family)
MGILDSVIGTVINQVVGGSNSSTGSGNAQLVMGVLSMLANSNGNSGQSGGVMGMVGNLLGAVGGNNAGGQSAGLGGLLGGVMGMLGGGQNQQTNPQAASALDNLNNGSGLGGLQQILEKAGLGEHMKSWVGTGENMPVSPEQLGQALDQDGKLTHLAQASGMSKEDTSSALASLLPHIVNAVTPNGQAPEGGLDLSSLVKQFIAK